MVWPSIGACDNMRDKVNGNGKLTRARLCISCERSDPIRLSGGSSAAKLACAYMEAKAHDYEDVEGG